MVEMEHDFMSKFWPKENYELIQMDTGENVYQNLVLISSIYWFVVNFLLSFHLYDPC